MPTLTIKYNNPITLTALKDFSKYFDYEIFTTVKKTRKKTSAKLNDYIVPADNTIDISDIFTIFSGKKISAADLRTKAWKRK